MSYDSERKALREEYDKKRALLMEKYPHKGGLDGQPPRIEVIRLTHEYLQELNELEEKYK